ncbi:MAG TPA: BON domain-containing protein [Stellaceae bacterium]|nr:BON domain-containing protein [Stellaceae bacterium]
MPHSAPPLRTWLLTGTLLAALPVLSGCIVAAAGAGAAGGYAVLGQEESPGDQLKDKTIAAQVAQSWEQYSRDLAHDLDDTVYQQRVLITGRVPSEEMHQEAVKRAWRVGNVKEVHDEIEVGPETHFSDQARDTVISTRLRTDLLADSNVKSINYTIKTENGVVYVIGSARSQAELNRVTDYARNIPNVRRVVSYVRIRGGEPSAAPTAASAAPAAASAAPPPAAASATPTPQDTQPTPPTPRGSIEVTPLK